jgi:outer membrane receptor for ferrienterochelin and colicins
LGVGYLGTYNSLGIENEGDPLLYTPEFKSEISYHFANIGLRASLFYKYNGRLSQYILSTNEDGAQQATLGTMEDFHTADFTVVKDVGENIKFTAGVRNLFNVQNINSTATGGSAHGGGGSVPVGYGRSYFIRANFNLNK